MKIFFLTEYSKKIGFGHLSRCIALAGVFEEMGFEIQFLIREWTSEKLDIPYSTMKVEWEKKRNLRDLTNYDGVFIFDTYRVEKESLNRLSKDISYPIAISDSKLNFPEKGMVIIGSIYGKKMLPFLPEGIDVLAGPEYIFFRKIFRDQPKVKIRPHIKKVLLSLGGFCSEKVINVLVQNLIQSLKEVEIVVIGSKVSIDNNLVINKDFLSKGDYLNELRSADLVISNGGQTLNEAVLLGVPCIALRMADNQKRNIMTWAKLGVVCSSGDPFNPNFERNFLKCLVDLKNQQERKTRVMKGESLLDDRGVFRVFKEILKKINEIKAK